MKSNTSKGAARSRRKHRRLLRRVTVITLFLVAAGLLTTLGWHIARGIASAVATGDQPVSDSPSTTAIPTTTTTHPTIAVGAEVSTPRVLVYDVTHSATLYSRDADTRCYPASLTKLLTAMIVTDQCEPIEEFTVGSELALLQPLSSRADLQSGYRLTRDMIIDALLLPSGNDAAYTMAVHVGRKVSGNPELNDLEAVFAFVDLMNEKAQKLGAGSSHFSNPDGYFSADHYTTASDMLLIAKAALKYDNLRQSVGRLSVNYELLSGQKVSFSNSNAIINPKSPYYFEGATGMKTGFTDEAGNCVVASARRNGIEVIAVIMGGLSTDSRWQDTVALLNKAFAAESAAS